MYVGNGQNQAQVKNTAEPIAPLPGPPMMGQKAYTPEPVGETEPVSPPKWVVFSRKLPAQWMRSWFGEKKAEVERERERETRRRRECYFRELWRGRGSLAAFFHFWGKVWGTSIHTQKKTKKNNSLEDPLFVTLAFLPVEQGAVALVSSMR